MIMGVAELAAAIGVSCKPYSDAGAYMVISKSIYKSTTYGLGVYPLQGPRDGASITGIVEGTDIEVARSLPFPFELAEFYQLVNEVDAWLADAHAEWKAQGKEGDDDQ